MPLLPLPQLPAKVSTETLTLTLTELISKTFSVLRIVGNGIGLVDVITTRHDGRANPFTFTYYWA